MPASIKNARQTSGAKNRDGRTASPPALRKEKGLVRSTKHIPANSLFIIPPELIEIVISHSSINDTGNIRVTCSYLKTLIGNMHTSLYNRERVRCEFLRLRVDGSGWSRSPFPTLNKKDWESKETFELQINYPLNHLKVVRAEERPYVISYEDGFSTRSFLELDRQLVPSQVLGCKQRYTLSSSHTPQTQSCLPCYGFWTLQTA